MRLTTPSYAPTVNVGGKEMTVNVRGISPRESRIDLKSLSVEIGHSKVTRLDIATFIKYLHDNRGSEYHTIILDFGGIRKKIYCTPTTEQSIDDILKVLESLLPAEKFTE